VDIKGTADTTPMDFLPSPQGLYLTSAAIRELIGLIYYKSKSIILNQ
jgi:hypothetical protein